jgi:SAM-dependent methyltransferase
MSFAGNVGFCCICMAETEFIAKGEWLRDEYICAKCGTIPRQRALVEILNLIRPDWRSCVLHESSPSMLFFSQQCSLYTYSFFFKDVPVGSRSPEGHRCENLEAMTFANETFDIFITQDVLEHVFNPDKALYEIMRVLRDEGIHIFTAPKHKTLLSSVQRARLNNGQVEHLLEPQYHGNPIGDGRSLVTWDYGVDFDDLVQQWSGYNTCNFVIRDRRLGIDGEFLDVFVTRKEPINVL